MGDSRIAAEQADAKIADLEARVRLLRKAGRTLLTQMERPEHYHPSIQVAMEAFSKP